MNESHVQTLPEGKSLKEEKIESLLGPRGSYVIVRFVDADLDKSTVRIMPRTQMETEHPQYTFMRTGAGGLSEYGVGDQGLIQALIEKMHESIP